MTTPTRLRSCACAAALLLQLGGCAIAPPAADPPAVPPQWQATLPHGGDTAALVDWWRRFDDPLLAELVAHAQADSPGVAQALARVGEARAALRSAQAAGLPGVTGVAQANRASSAATSLVATSQASVGADASWEVDLFGGVRFGIAAARARTEQAELGWHEARVSLAAEVAQRYLGLRSCEALAQVYQQAVQSQDVIARLTHEKVRVGFEAPASAALADASSAQTRDRLLAQRADCDRALKALVALSGLAEPVLRERTAAAAGRLPQPGAFALQPVPAALLAQRPDVAAAERELRAAAAEVGGAQAQRYPQLRLGGSLGVGVLRVAGATQDAVTWSFGPTLSLPLFDGGRSAAQVDASRARFEGARAALDARVRSAVQEVEDALVRIAGAEQRGADALRAAEGYREVFEAAQARWRIGAGSLIELEDARRRALDAQAGLLGVSTERVAAWIALYRAAGGGWQADDKTP